MRPLTAHPPTFLAAALPMRINTLVVEGEAQVRKDLNPFVEFYSELSKQLSCPGLDGSHYSTTSYKGQGYGGGGEQ